MTKITLTSAVSFLLSGSFFEFNLNLIGALTFLAGSTCIIVVVMHLYCGRADMFSKGYQNGFTSRQNLSGMRNVNPATVIEGAGETITINEEEEGLPQVWPRVITSSNRRISTYKDGRVFYEKRLPSGKWVTDHEAMKKAEAEDEASEA